MDQYLSKTDFKVGCSCPRKLWYKKQRYPTVNDENEYMQYLAKGGYVVGKVAQLIYGNGIDLSHIKDSTQAITETQKIIENNKNITIYEATFYSKNKLVRVDILEKKENVLRIIEVKSKSQASDDETGQIPSEYLNDVLFQVLTVEEAYPQYQIEGCLFLPDKSKLNQIEGLAGWFIVDEERSELLELDELPARATGIYTPKIRFKYEDSADKEKYVNELRANSIMELRDIQKTDFGGNWNSAKQQVKNAFENLYQSLVNGGAQGVISKGCKTCEFASDENQKNGFKECWAEIKDQDLSALDLYYGGAIQQGKGNYYLNHLIDMKTLSLNDIDVNVITKGKEMEALSNRAIRQVLQIDAAKSGKEQVRKDVLNSELNGWEFPLFFIDFETYTGAIPFHVKMRPYELIAFQWSCHKLEADGTLQHYEWINLKETFPNFEFAEKLMEILGASGTPLMWSHHENTVLRHILAQMDIQGYQNNKLKSWLIAMTHDKREKREGRLVDMAKVCESTYLHPDCKGKVSIKKILPVIWNNSNNKDLHEHDFFKEYFKQDEKGNLIDPYKTLNPVVEFLETSDLESEDVVAEGTAAMRAYFDLMYGKGAGNDNKKKEIRELLLQYCKLDTVAMVLIYMYWFKLCKQQN